MPFFHAISKNDNFSRAGGERITWAALSSPSSLEIMIIFFQHVKHIFNLKDYKKKNKQETTLLDKIFHHFLHPISISIKENTIIGKNHIPQSSLPLKLEKTIAQPQLSGSNENLKFPNFSEHNGIGNSKIYQFKK